MPPKNCKKNKHYDENNVPLTPIYGTLCYKRSDIPEISYIKKGWDFRLFYECFKHSNGRYYLSTQTYVNIKRISIKMYWKYMLIEIGRRHFEKNK